MIYGVKTIYSVYKCRTFNHYLHHYKTTKYCRCSIL